MRQFGVVLVLAAAGCGGPLMYPMVDRLPEEDQKTVDSAWQNMFTPADRLDHMLLLDVVMANLMFQRGVDQLEMTSVKNVGKARVLMTVQFDREHPEFDAFVVSYIDEHGKELRRERYSGNEVRERIQYFHEHSGPKPQNEEEQAVHEEKCRLFNQRIEEIKAATQPVQ